MADLWLHDDRVSRTHPGWVGLASHHGSPVAPGVPGAVGGEPVS